MVEAALRDTARLRKVERHRRTNTDNRHWLREISIVCPPSLGSFRLPYYEAVILGG
jgi:hypothetical protein